MYAVEGGMTAIEAAAAAQMLGSMMAFKSGQVKVGLARGFDRRTSKSM